MKTKKWMCFVAALSVMMASSSCHDWGEMDPPAGNDIYPTLENVAQYTFDDETLDPMLFKTGSYNGADIPELYEDPEKGQVLYLNNGYVTMNNPLSAVTCQTAVSMTFWMKQDVAVDEESGEALPQDLTGALFGFSNDNNSGNMFFTANGWLSYSGVDGEWSDNDPSQYQTGYMTPGEWHYVALIVRKDGYGLYVDGQRKVDKQVADFDMSKLVRFMNNVSTLYIGKGGDSDTAPRYVDDIKIYRNQITDKEIARPNMSGGGSGDVDLSKWILIGAEDNSAAWWTVWSPNVALAGDGTIHYQFYNYGSGGANWNNWVLVISNGKYVGEDGYAENLVMRADSWGWGGNISWDDCTVTNDYDFSTFIGDLQGALVDMDITRKGNTVTVSTVAYCENGKTLHYEVIIPNVETPEIGTFFVLDSSHLLMNPDQTFVGRTYAPGEYTMGAADFSSGFWSVWTPMEKFTAPFANFGFEFINHNSGVGSNWQNWNYVITNGYQSGGSDAEYAEYYYLRSDAYGWGSLYDSSTMTQSFDWTTYVADMHDSTHRIYFTYANNTLTMVNRGKRADGSAMPEYRFVTPDIPLPLSIIFTGEGCQLEFLRVGYFPWVDMSAE